MLPWHYTKPSSSRPEVLRHGCSPAVRAALFSSHRWQSCSKSRVPAAQKRKQFFFLLLTINRRECILPLNLMLPEGSVQAGTTSMMHRAVLEGQRRHQTPSEHRREQQLSKKRPIKHKDPSTPSLFSIPFWLDAIAPPCTLQYISVVLIPHLDTVERLYSHTKRFPSLQPNSCAVPEGSQDQPEPFPTLR